MCFTLMLFEYDACFANLVHITNFISPATFLQILGMSQCEHFYTDIVVCLALGSHYQYAGY